MANGTITRLHVYGGPGQFFLPTDKPETILVAPSTLTAEVFVEPVLDGIIEVNGRVLNQALFIGEDNKNVVFSMKDTETCAFVNDASGTFGVLDCDGTPVVDMEDLPMSYVQDSNGKYLGILSSGLSSTLQENTTYQLETTLTSQNRTLHRKHSLPAVYRGKV